MSIGDVHFLQKCTSPIAFAGVPICVLPCPFLHFPLSPSAKIPGCSDTSSQNSRESDSYPYELM